MVAEMAPQLCCDALPASHTLTVLRMKAPDILLCLQANGSVYFDVAAFRASEGKIYGKLVDASMLMDKDLMAEGEAEMPLLERGGVCCARGRP